MSEPRPARLDLVLSGAISGCHCSCLIHERAEQRGASLPAPERKGCRHPAEARSRRRINDLFARRDRNKKTGEMCDKEEGRNQKDATASVSRVVLIHLGRCCSVDKCMTV